MTNSTRPQTAPARCQLLTRTQVARQLGVSITTVHRLRQKGYLHPQQDVDGIQRYDLFEVVRVGGIRGLTHKRTEGETTSLAFQMFERGSELAEVVITLQLSTDEVRQLYRDFNTSLYEPAPP
jgi:DNA-binding transcriptional MerR regulator